MTIVTLRILLKDIIKKNLKLIKIIAVIVPPVIAVCVIIYLKYYYVPGHGVSCFTYKYFGLYCMGCGGTRQLYYAINGEFIKAFMMNPACVVLYPTYGYLYYLIIKWAVKDKKITHNEALIIAASALLLSLYAIVRNIPIKALDFLRP